MRKCMAVAINKIFPFDGVVFFIPFLTLLLKSNAYFSLHQNLIFVLKYTFIEYNGPAEPVDRTTLSQ